MSTATATSEPTPAFTNIVNQAYAEFFDEFRGISGASLSNSSSIEVLPLYDVEIENPRELFIEPGDHVTFGHNVIHTGNAPDRFILTADNLLVGDDFDLSDIVIYHDVNQNGIPDPGEPEVVQTPLLQPGEYFPIAISAVSPAFPAEGDTASIEVVATSVNDPTKNDSLVDTVIVGEGANLEIILDSNHDCSSSVDPGEILEFDVFINNQGTAEPPARAISVDGVAQSGVLFEVDIAGGLELFPTANFNAIPSQGQVLVHPAGSGPNVWESFASWNGTDLVDQIGVLYPTTVFNAGTSAAFDFELRVTETATAGAQLTTQVIVDEAGDGSHDELSGEGCTRVSDDAPPAVLRYVQPVPSIRQDCQNNPGLCAGPDHATDSDFEDVEVFTLRDLTDPADDYNATADGIYLELTATQLNQSGVDVEMWRESFNDPNVSEVITVAVRSQITGDTINVTMLETGPNTGVFRSIRPVTLVESDTPNDQDCPPHPLVVDELQTPEYIGPNSDEPSCIFQSAPNDVLFATITVGRGGNQQSLLDTAIVNPVSVVFDSTSRIPLQGAVVSIFNVDDPSNPIEITDPLNPIVTDENGEYEIPLLPPGNYFVDVNPTGVISDINYNFPSVVPADAFALQREVGPFSYGRDGFSGVPGSGVLVVRPGDLPVIIDIPLDPDVDSGFIGLEKEAGVEVTTIGSFVPFTLTLSNTSQTVLTNAKVIDTLPLGFEYVTGSVRVGGVGVGGTFDPTPQAGGFSINAIEVKDPEGAPGPVITFDVARLDIGATIIIEYAVLVRPGAVNGSGINTAVATGQTGAGNITVVSPSVRDRVLLEEEALLSNDAYIFGKLYVDGDCNDEQTFREWPIGGVRLYLEDGTYVVTDEHGQYSLYGIKPGNHVIKVDTTTLPEGVTLKPLDTRSAAYGESRFVDLLSGEWHRADFATMCPCGDWASVMEEIRERNASVNGDWMLEQAATYRSPDAGRTSVQSAAQRRLRTGQRGPDGDQSNGQVWGPNVSLDSTGRGRGRGHDASVSTAATERLAKSLGVGEVVEQPVFESTDAWARRMTRAQVKEGTFFWPTNGIDVDGRYQVATRQIKDMQLLIDGVPVPESQLGEEFLSNDAGGVVRGWYGVKMDVGHHKVEVVGIGPFGNRRVLAEQEVYKPGVAQRFELTPHAGTAEADGGRTALGFDIVMLDKNGEPAIGTYYLTLESENGHWLGEDIQPNEPGHQIRVVGLGTKTVWLQTSSYVGKVDVRVTETGGTLRQRRTVEFIEPMREMIAVGLVEIGGGYQDSSVGFNAPVNGEFDDGFNGDSRAAFFLKGRIKGDMLLTMSYDSDKDSDEDDLFRDIDPAKYYPLYGDASSKGYEAQARSQAYVKLERGTKSIMWGDFATDTENRASLARVQGSFTGLNGRWEGERLAIRAFAAEVDNPQVVEEIPGNGTARDYQLVTAVPFLRHSEIVEIVLRDEDNIGLTLETENLVRYRDYVIDHLTGRLTIFSAVPPRDDEGNPFFIRVSYEAEGNSPEHLVAGARVDYSLTDWLSVGGSYTLDEHVTEGYDISALNARVVVNEQNSLLVEVAGMTHVDGSADGEAVRVDWTAQMSQRLSGRLIYARADEGFIHKGAGISADREELRGDLSFKIFDGHTDLKLEGILSRGLSGLEERQAVGVAIAQKLGGWEVELGLRQIDQTDELANVTSFATGRMRLERAFDWRQRNGRVHVEYETALEGQSADSLQIGADYDIRDNVRLYARHEIIDSVTGISALTQGGARRTNTVIGVDADFLGNTRTYTEYRQRGAISSQELEAATGIRGSFEIKPKVSISPDFAYVRFMEGARSGEEEWSLSIGYTDLSKRNSKTAARVEYRSAPTKDFYSFDATYVARLNLDWSSLLRNDFQMDDPRDGSANSFRNAFTWGVARRPRLDNRYHMVAMYQWIIEDNFNTATTRTETHLVSTHQNYQLNSDFRIGGQLGMKWQDTAALGLQLRSTVQIAGIRFIKDLGRRLDLDVHAGVLSSDWGDSYLSSFGVGVNALVVRNLRAGVAYNFEGFEDSQLDSDKYHRHGLHLSLQWKFDEHLFDWLAADDLDEVQAPNPRKRDDSPIILGSMHLLQPEAIEPVSSADAAEQPSQQVATTQTAESLRTSRRLMSRAN